MVDNNRRHRGRDDDSDTGTVIGSPEAWFRDDLGFGSDLSDGSGREDSGREVVGGRRKPAAPSPSPDPEVEAETGKVRVEAERIIAQLREEGLLPLLDKPRDATLLSDRSADWADWADATKRAVALESFMNDLRESSKRKALLAPPPPGPLIVGAALTEGGGDTLQLQKKQSLLTNILKETAKDRADPQRSPKRQRPNPFTPPSTAPRGPRTPARRKTPGTPTPLNTGRKTGSRVTAAERGAKRPLRASFKTADSVEPPGDDSSSSSSDDDRPPFVNRDGNIVPALTPPAATPSTRRNLHRFCMSVLRSMVVRYTRNQQPAYEIPQIVTVRDASASVLCERCRRLNAQCLTAHRTMLGDAWDMVTLLEAARESFLNNPALPGALDPAPSQEIIADLVVASWEMLAAFVSADRAYRKAHNLTTDPRHQRRPNELLVLPVMEARSAQVMSLLTSPLALADPRAAAFGSPLWQSLALLRLEEGDAGHELWSRHRSTYVQKLRDLRRRWSLEPGVVSTRDELCIIPAVGPYGGQL